MRSVFSMFATLAIAITAAAELRVGRVEGVLLERGTKKPLADVNIFILPAKLKATTDAQGRFVIDGVPEGEIQFVVNAPGYNRLDKTERFLPDEARESRRLYLERTAYQGLEVTITGQAKKRDDSVRTLKAEQFITIPGANGDPVKAVQNLPGVARVNGFSSQVIIQGSAPQDTSYLFDDHSVPLVFHFGGLTSVITPEAIEQVDYLSAGYGPEYGRAIGGIVGLRTRDPAIDRTKGFLFADITKAGGLVEGPIDEKSSYLVTARYSYLGFVLQQALKDNPRFDLAVAPSFGDVAGVYRRKMSESDDLRLVALGSHDELKFLLKEPLREDPSIRGNFSNTTDFYRFIPQWTHRFDASTTGRFSLGLGQDFLKVDVGDNYFDLKTVSISPRVELEQKPNARWTSYLGLDSEFTHADVALRLPNFTNQGGVSNPISTGETVEVSIEDDTVVLGPYWRNTFRPAADSKWTFMPSVRVDYFSSTREVKPQPRLAARFEESESLFYKAATGLYYQPPEPQEIAEGYGNPDVKSPYAWHFTLGGEKDFRGGSADGFTLQTNLFYRIFENLVLPSNRTVVRDGVLAFERYNNDGRGRAYGAEFLVKYEAKPWTGWLAYTLSRSLRTEPGQEEHVSQYDQTHNINLVGSVDLASNWKLSGRVRYVTGNPFTPIIGGTFDADNDVYLPRRGPFYSERDDAFFQVDFRADKKWIYDDWILWGYIDIQNITNRENTEGIRYSYDYSQRKSVTGLPILPTIGVRGEF